MESRQINKYIHTFIAALCLALLLISCKSMNAAYKIKKAENRILEAIVCIDEPGSKGQSFQAQYLMLNRDILGKNLTSWFTEEMQEEIYKYSEQVKGVFLEVQNEKSIFPPELIKAIEEILYQSFDTSLNKISWEDIQKSIYFNVTKEFNADKFELDMDQMKSLFPELEKSEIEITNKFDAYKLVSGTENCVNMFHFQMASNQDNYVILESSGGSNGAIVVELTKRENGEFITISSFETQNEGYGRVIQYGGEFYYIFAEYNYNLKTDDGIRIHRLGENAAEENLLIKYLPYNYIWKNVYMTTEGSCLGTYLDNIKDDITSNRYMEKGLSKDIAVFCGDEEEDAEFKVPSVDEVYFGSNYYKIDFANIGVPVYMRKSNFIPSNYRTVWQFKCRFFLQDLENDCVCELERLEIGAEAIPPASNRPNLVQMWFKEIEGKVYTLCLYHVFDYNYVFCAYVLDGNQIERIRTDILSPQRAFILTEGEKFFSG